ncbi:uncharacterized protein LOC114187649 isoform X2 [Vigna unguiculata]|uniref:uncharacterized protein LOC114187649 isoform X2 n=1 Tax=Vigna unguiculata TaxID=3917 RepID=UPI001016708D|nr:uncharacterized protein LOC114187649 isoform X2 [Vigna unguiculata]
MFEFFLLFLLFLHESIFFFSKKSYFHSSSSTKKATLENDNKTFRPQDLLHQRVSFIKGIDGYNGRSIDHRASHNYLIGWLTSLIRRLLFVLK